MKKRPLGSTGITVAPVGLGAAQLGSSVYEHSKDIVFRALDLGVNYFDTARGYWDSEIKLGKALKGERENIIILERVSLICIGSYICWVSTQYIFYHYHYSLHVFKFYVLQFLCIKTILIYM